MSNEEAVADGRDAAVAQGLDRNLEHIGRVSGLLHFLNTWIAENGGASCPTRETPTNRRFPGWVTKPTENDMARAQAGRVVTKDVRQKPDDTWGVTVWFGSHPATYIQRYY